MTTLTSSETIAAFLVPITVYPNIGRLQQALLKFAVTTGSPSLAAGRLVALLFDLDLSALFLQSVTPVDFSGATPAVLATVTSVQELLAGMAQYNNYVQFAIEEARAFLPTETVEILNNYNTDGSPVYRAGVAILLVLAANLQGP